jgi:hypothetical protein
VGGPAAPITVDGWGLHEGGMVYVIGVPGESTLVLSVLYGLFTLGEALRSGLVWLASGVQRDDIEAAQVNDREALPESEIR